MMRKLIVMAMVAGLVGLGGLVRDAQAGATVDLLFVGKNGAPITPTGSLTAAPSDTLVLAVLMRNDQVLSVMQFDVTYDVGPADVTLARAWAGLVAGPAMANKFSPLSQPVFNNATGLVTSFNSVIGVPPALPLPVFGGAFAAANPLGYQVGTINWHVNDTNQNDVTAVFGLGQGFFTTNGAPIPLSDVLFNNAVVNIPEPATAALLGLGLIGILAVGRRRSRS